MKTYLSYSFDARGLRALEPHLWSLYGGKCRTALGDPDYRIPQPPPGWLTMEVLITVVELGADLGVVLEYIDAQIKSLIQRCADREATGWQVGREY